MAAELSLKVGGEWLDRVGWWGEVVVTDRWPGLCYGLSWRMALEPGERPPALMPRPGKPKPLVEAFLGSRRRWTGYLQDADWDEGTFTATGLYRAGETVLAVDNAGNAQLDLGWALYWASEYYGRGALTWTALESFDPITDDPATDLNTISALTDEYARQKGRRWGVTADNLMFTSEDWTAPQLMVYPSVADIGATVEGAVDVIYARYIDKTTLNYRTAIVGTPGPGLVEEALDLTDRDRYGYLTTAQAQAIASGYRAQASTAWNFTNGLTLTYGMVTTPGGEVVDMADVIARKLIRVYGCRDPRNGQPYTDFVIGESIWTTDDGVVQANPIQMVGRDQESVLEDIAKGVLA